jgi:hypothetical protein
MTAQSSSGCYVDEKMDDIDFLNSNLSRQYLAKRLNLPLTHFQLPKSLFQYRAFKTFSLKNILTSKLTLVNPSKFDDLYDSYLHFDTSQTLKTDLDFIRLYGKLIGVDISEDWISDRIEDNEKHEDYIAENLLTDLRVTCFSERSDNPLMWGLYADNNKGFCAEYDFSNYMNKNLIFPINYSETPYDVTSEIESEKIIQAIILTSTIKDNRWKDQKEWRLILLVPFLDPEDFLPIINVPNPKRIIIGEKFSPKNLNTEEQRLLAEFRDFLATNEIPIYKCKRSRGNFTIEMVECDYNVLE